MKHEAIRLTIGSSEESVDVQITSKIKTVKSLCFVQTKTAPMPTVKLDIGGIEIISEGTDVALFKKTDSIGLNDARYKIDTIEDSANKNARVTIKDSNYSSPYEVILYLFDE